MRLTTARLFLRPFTAADVAWLHPICSDPVLTRFTTWGPNTPEETEAFLVEAVDGGDGPENHIWAIESEDARGEGVGIGSAGLEVFDPERGHASFGYNIDPSRWGRGYATEAAAAMVDFMAHDLRMRRIEATCRPENVASARVLEKVGLVLQGQRRGPIDASGLVVESLVYAVDVVDGVVPTGR